MSDSNTTSPIYAKLGTLGTKEKTKDYLKGAVAVYVRLGLHPILLHGVKGDVCGCFKGSDCPIKTRGKHPVDGNWETGRLNTTSMVAIIGEWLHKILPNLGLRMGVQPDGVTHLIAVDDDGQLAAFEEEYSALPKDTMTLRSGSGGRHLVYSVPAGIDFDNKVGIKSQLTGKAYKVDIRTQGGQIVVAPSMHWSGGQYGVELAAPPAALPEKFIELFKAAPEVSTKFVPTAETSGTPLAERAWKYLLAMPVSVEHGDGEKSGHVRLLQAANALYWGFYPDLSMADCDALFAQYNGRGDPENEGQLAHKKKDALSGKGKTQPQGYLARRGKGRPPRPIPTDAELMELAGDMVEQYEPAPAREVFRMDVSAAYGLEAADEAPTPAPEVCRTRPCTDIGNSERLADMFGTRVLYLELAKQWYAWDGTRFKMVTEVDVQAKAKLVAQSIYAEAAKATEPKQKRSLALWAVESQKAARVASMIRLVRDAVRVDPAELDNQPWLLNCPNGTIDLKTGKLLPHDPKHLITQITRFDYDPTVESPLLKQHLERCQPDPRVRAYLGRSMGYAITGLIREHMYEVHTGTGKDATEGRNGKGTALRGFQWVLGDYAGYPPTSIFVSSGDHNKQHPTEYMTLQKKRFSVVGETERGDRLNVAVVKRLTGGDSVNGRRMRMDFDEDFQPTHKLHNETNNLPRIVDCDAATWDRIRVITWPVHLDATERQGDFRDRLKLEGTGILTWLVQGCLAWQAAGELTLPPQSIVEATLAYKGGEDDLGQFLLECTEKDETQRVSADELYKLYTTFCEEGGKHPLAKQSLSKSLIKRGLSNVKSEGRMHWSGIKSLGTEAHRATMAAYRADSEKNRFDDTPEGDAEIESMLASGDIDDGSEIH